MIKKRLNASTQETNRSTLNNWDIDTWSDLFFYKKMGKSKNGIFWVFSFVVVCLSSFCFCAELPHDVNIFYFTLLWVLEVIYLGCSDGWLTKVSSETAMQWGKCMRKQLVSTGFTLYFHMLLSHAFNAIYEHFHLPLFDNQ